MILCGNTCGHNHDSLNGPTGCCPDHGPHMYYCDLPHPPKEETMPDVPDLGAIAARATANLNGDPTPTGPPCSKCGKAMPPLSEEIAAIVRKTPGVTFAHEVCPGQEAAAPTGRYFEVRVQVVEVTEPTPPRLESGELAEVDPADFHVEEMISFVAGHRAPNLDAAMRPLALALGERWEKAERQAGVADS